MLLQLQQCFSNKGKNLMSKQDAKNTLVKQLDGSITYGDGSPLVRFDGDGLQKQISDLTALDCSVEPSLTVQSFAAECDINTIMAQYDNKMSLVPPSDLAPRYGDTTLLADFQTSVQLIADANASFAALPANVRKRFSNDPQEFVAYLSESGHEAELRELGLITPTVAQEAPLPPEAPTPTGDS
jgi:phage internal scaffolding protein